MRVLGGLLHGILEKGIDGPVSCTRYTMTSVWAAIQSKREMRQAHGKPIHQPPRGDHQELYRMTGNAEHVLSLP